MNTSASFIKYIRLLSKRQPIFLLKNTNLLFVFVILKFNNFLMKNTILILGFFFLIMLSCTSKKNSLQFTEKKAKTTSDTVRIANDSLEYEVIIIDPGYSFWLASRAFPRGYHSQSFLENKNLFFVNEWNNRVLQPQRFNPNLYEMTINYDSNINYGYEVNYLIYNYFIFFQNTYNQKLFGFVPIR